MRDKSKKKEASKKWANENKEKLRHLQSKWALENKDKIIEAGRKWKRNNREKARKICSEWKKKNPAKNRAAVSKYKASKTSQAHPDNDKIKELQIYNEAVKRSIETGILYQVDHIIPLSEGGYHHHENLAVIPSDINNSKHDDPFWEKEGYKSWRDVPEHLWPEKLKEAYNSLKSK